MPGRKGHRSAFGLTVSEAETEIVCLQTKGGGKGSFAINAAGQVYKQNDRVCVLGRGHQRRQTPQHRDHAATSEGLGVLPAVQDGTL